MTKRQGDGKRSGGRARVDTGRRLGICPVLTQSWPPPPPPHPHMCVPSCAHCHRRPLSRPLSRPWYTPLSRPWHTPPSPGTARTHRSMAATSRDRRWRSSPSCRAATAAATSPAAGGVSPSTPPAAPTRPVQRFSRSRASARRCSNRACCRAKGRRPQRRSREVSAGLPRSRGLSHSRKAACSTSQAHPTCAHLDG